MSSTLPQRQIRNSQILEVKMQKTQLAAALVAVLGLSLNGMARAADNTETTEKTEVKTEKKVKMDKKECKKECKKDKKRQRSLLQGQRRFMQGQRRLMQSQIR
jgi:Ni/Co efflux regulator RcnB